MKYPLRDRKNSPEKTKNTSDAKKGDTPLFISSKEQYETIKKATKAKVIEASSNTFKINSLRLESSFVDLGDISLKTTPNIFAKVYFIKKI